MCRAACGPARRKRAGGGGGPPCRCGGSRRGRRRATAPARTRAANGARISISRASRPVTSSTTPRGSGRMRRRCTEPSASSSARLRNGRRPSCQRYGGGGWWPLPTTVARRSKRPRAGSTISARSRPIAGSHGAPGPGCRASYCVDFDRAAPILGVHTMRPSEQQHREALAGHANPRARFLRGEVPNDSWRPIRLSYGLYYQLDHTSHMQRIKIPGGLLTAEQLDAMAEISDLYGRGIAHVTTRQDIQIHWVPLDRIIDMYERLLAVDITTRGACSDSVRNVTGCPFAGVSPDEPFAVPPSTLRLH